MLGNIKSQSRFLRVMPVFVIIGIALLAALFLPTSVFSQTESQYSVEIHTDADGHQVDEVIFSGRPPEIKAALASVPEPNIAMGTNILTNVPAFYWSYGCSATAAAMLFGYYDNGDYVDMYTGPTNGGVVPMDNSIWGSGECPLSATHQGVDGLVTRGHVDDYWIAYGSSDDDPFIGNWTEHTHADCTGDFMGTNQSSFSNTDGSTTIYFDSTGAPLYDFTDYEPNNRDGCHGLRLFAESRGYTVATNFSQYIHGQGSNPALGFTFADFQAEIDGGRPVLIHVTGHTMLGYGYNTAGSIVYIHDTWDYSDHQMTWGGTYKGYQHFGVTVIELEELPLPTVTIEASDTAINDDDIGIGAFTVTATFSEVMDDSHVPTLVFDPLLTTTLTNPSGAWSAGDTVYTWTYDIEDAGVKADDVDVTVEGGRDLDGDAQVPGTNLDYIDVDTQNPTVTIVASDMAINDGDAGVDVFTVTAAFSEAMDNSQVPTVVFDQVLTNTLTNPSGAWSAGDTVYTWTYDIEDAGVKADDVDVTVEGGWDLAGNTQVPGTNPDYIDVDTQNPTVTIVASDMAINDGDVGVDVFIITATFSEVMDNSQVPTVVFDQVLTNTLISPSGAWSAGDTVYAWTYDIEDAGIKVVDVDVTVDGGMDLAGNTQIPGTNTDYIDVDTENPTMTIVASSVVISDDYAGADAFSIIAVFSEAMDSSQVPTLFFDPLLTTTLTNPSGAWSAGFAVYTWTYDIEDAGIKVDDIDITVEGGRDLAGNTQIPGTNTDYIDVDTQNPTLTIVASDKFIYDGDAGVNAFTITATFSETMDNAQIPTLSFDPVLTSTLTNPSGSWSAGDTIYTWTYDIEDAGIKVDDIDVMVEGGKDLAGNTQMPCTNPGYIDLDTQNPIVIITDIDDPVNGLAYVSGAASDTTVGGLHKVEVVIENATDSEYWDGSSWISTKTWLNATGLTSWVYNTRSVTFVDGKSYIVKASTTDKAGNTSTVSSDSFAFYEIPAAAFKATPTSGNVPLTVQFTDESTGIINTYTWYFGDGQTSNEWHPSHIYDSPGTYIVILKATGPGGTDTEIKIDFITVERRSGLGECACPITEEKVPMSELLLGWGITGLCFGTGYYLVRKAGKPGK